MQSSSFELRRVVRECTLANNLSARLPASCHMRCGSAMFSVAANLGTFPAYIASLFVWQIYLTSRLWYNVHHRQSNRQASSQSMLHLQTSVRYQFSRKTSTARPLVDLRKRCCSCSAQQIRARWCIDIKWVRKPC
jgi:hypothetical protein